MSERVQISDVKPPNVNKSQRQLEHHLLYLYAQKLYVENDVNWPLRCKFAVQIVYTACINKRQRVHCKWNCVVYSCIFTVWIMNAYFKSECVNQYILFYLREPLRTKIMIQLRFIWKRLMLKLCMNKKNVCLW